ncbi:Aste57867_12915 [Aphanomyces stellatus]|uniref:Aste57867_12915 protein n=1 Tax=Aphanomyces stellatus TaxID=120398 RepID=A0A485KXM7_9STRA|nr:hypothetical protein As57867_012867 [Aphanomyces stellatus]VFT89761.1 Aste57867_12915 [Aphanomyces stellatus]
MIGDSLTISPASRRELESFRKKRYRVLKKNERCALAESVRRLEAHVAQLTRLRTCSWREASDKLFRERLETYGEHTSLRAQLRRQQELLRLVYGWVAPVATSLEEKRSWSQYTLLAHPVARRYGYTWLSERVYHAARATALPMDPLGGSMADATSVHMMSDAGRVVGFEMHSQMTLLANFKVVADVLWPLMLQTGRKTNFQAKDVEVIDGTTMYQHTESLVLGTSYRVIFRLFVEASRFILTMVYILDDESNPLRANERRVYGYDWAIFERVTDDITLWREARVLYTPMTTEGELALDDHAPIFGVEKKDQSNQVLLAQIEAAAADNWDTVQRSIFGIIEDRLAALSTN